MSTSQVNANPHEKQRLRDQIRSQIEEFLINGGTIEVFDNGRQHTTDKRASVWHEQVSFSLAVD